jgi:iron complex outermembrane recepter protein
MTQIHRLSPLTLACLGLSALAQTTPEPQTLPVVKVVGQKDDYRAPDTATGNRTATPSLQSPQSAQVVTRAVIDDQNALNLAEALRNVSGVHAV